jgi:hypothetical protein
MLVCLPLLVLATLMGVCEARPPSRQPPPRGYYGPDNPCKLQVVPWPAEVHCDAVPRQSVKLTLNFSLVLAEESMSRDSAVLRSALGRYAGLISAPRPLHLSRGLLVEPQFLLEGDDDDYSYASADASAEAGADSRVYSLGALVVVVAEDLPEGAVKQLDDDESYSLTVDIDSSGAARARVEAGSVWGALYALETFSQLVEYGGQIRHFPISIQDEPRFPWRGLLLDTSNHYISVSVISKFLDAMAATKMNVLHWHLVDSYSFPFLSKSLPEMAEAGAWLYTEENGQGVIDMDRDMDRGRGRDRSRSRDRGSSSDAPPPPRPRPPPYRNTVYAAADLEYVEAFAAARGVRVVVEVDMPGKPPDLEHTLC